MAVVRTKKESHDVFTAPTTILKAALRGLVDIEETGPRIVQGDMS